MKRFLCLLATMLLLSTWSLAQDKKAPEKKAGGGVEQALIDLEHKWITAGLKNDAAALAEILADTWSTVDAADGKVVTRAQTLEDTKKVKFSRSEISDVKVRMINADTAVVTGVWSGAGTDAKGQKIDTTERWTDIFANQGGKWKCVASHNTTIKK